MRRFLSATILFSAISSSIFAMDQAKVLSSETECSADTECHFKMEWHTSPIVSGSQVVTGTSFTSIMASGGRVNSNVSVGSDHQFHACNSGTASGEMIQVMGELSDSYGHHALRSYHVSLPPNSCNDGLLQAFFVNNYNRVGAVSLNAQSNMGGGGSSSDHKTIFISQ